MRIARHGRPRYAGVLWSDGDTTNIGRCALLSKTPHGFNNHTSDKWSLCRQAVSRLASTGSSAAQVSVRGLQYPGRRCRLTGGGERMNAESGDVYAQSVAKDFVFDKLGGRTVERALADGVDAKAVWRAVCDTFKVPENMR